jgi:hypothetical protein
VALPHKSLNSRIKRGLSEDERPIAFPPAATLARPIDEGNGWKARAALEVL